MSSGALPPAKAAQDTLKTGLHHLSEDLQLAFLKNIYGAMLLSAGGLLSLIIETGCPSLTKSNPGLGNLLQGLTFPIGLVLVYFVGAELYTGYPMWFIMTALERKGKPLQYLRAILASWVGNLLGALLFSFVFTYLTDTLAEDPFKSGTIELVTSEILEKPWHIIFLRSIPCGWLVTFSMLLGTQNHDGISKALALHLPFFISTTAKMPHTVKYMYLGITAMLLGADMSVGTFVGKCLVPITLGNTIGGMVFTGGYSWWVHVYCKDEKAAMGGSGGFGSLRLDDDEDD